MICEHSDIVNLETDPGSPPQWAFSKSACNLETIELVESESTEAEFYLDKRVSYGDFFIVIFLSIFTIFIICREIAKFVFHHID